MSSWFRHTLAWILVLGTLVQSVYGGMAVICLGCTSGAIAATPPPVPIPRLAGCCSDGETSSTYIGNDRVDDAVVIKQCGCDDAGCNCVDIQGKGESAAAALNRGLVDLVKVLQVVACHDLGMAASDSLEPWQASPFLSRATSNAIALRQASVIARCVVLLI
jgi:hypothetical protein